MKKHAYLILVHGDLFVFKYLMMLLDDVRNDIFVHVDKKVNIDNFIEQIPINPKSEIYFLNEREDISWGSYEMVLAEMKLFKAAKATPSKYTFYHMISGVDMPLKSQDEIHNFFEKYEGNEFIQFWDEAEMIKDKYINRYKYYEINKMTNRTIVGKLTYHICRNMNLFVQKTIRINRLKNKKVYMGSQWLSISDDLVDFLIAQEKQIDEMYRKTLVPDESFIQTFVLNSSFKDKLYSKIVSDSVTSNSRFIKFENGKPKIWKYEDFDILNESQCCFARKFDSKIDKEIILKIVENMK